MNHYKITCTLLLLNGLSVFIYGSTTAQCKSGDCQNGIGMFVYSVNTIYEGNFRNGLPNGTGRLLRENGDEYQGEFVNGLYSGQGQLIYANGDVYTGGFREGMRQGKGLMAKANGSRQDGLFLNNLFAGDFKPGLELKGMNFNTGDQLSSRNADLDDSLPIVWMGGTAFDKNTGSLLLHINKPASTTPVTIHTIRLENKTYEIGRPELTAYMKARYERSKYQLDPYTVLKYGNDYYIGRSYSQPNKKGGFLTRIYQVDSKGISTIATIATPGSFDYGTNEAYYHFFFNPDNSVFLMDNKLYSQQGTVAATVQLVKEEKRDESRTWFSPNGDTLIHFRRNIEDTINGFTIRKYLVASGQLVSTIQFPMNRRLLATSPGKPAYPLPYEIQRYDYARQEAIVVFDWYRSGNYVYDGGNKIQSYADYSKAAVIRLSDPDYLLPLVNPLFDTASFARLTSAANAESSAFFEQRRKKIEEAIDSRPINLFLDDPTTSPKKKVTGNGTAGVCMWCKGSGKTVTQDVYNKGYNSNYSGPVGGRYTVATGSTSSTTTTCPVCAGSGH